ncbi:MAG: right-handed parallel beta-helix repeat-containing protein, partial [Candidatus Asgardarchaeia archaeon]
MSAIRDECKYNRFEGNDISYNTNDGIYFHYDNSPAYYYNDYNEIINNSIYSNSGDGIDIRSNNYYNVMSGNTLDGNGGY